MLGILKFHQFPYLLKHGTFKMKKIRIGSLKQTTPRSTLKVKTNNSVDHAISIMNDCSV